MMDLKRRNVWTLTLVTLLVAGLSLTACGDETETETENNTENNEEVNNSNNKPDPTNNSNNEPDPTNNSNNEPDPTNNTNNTQNNNPPPPLDPEPIGELIYEVHTDGYATLSISINVVTGRISRSTLLGGRSYQMETADVEYFKTNVLTNDVYDKMRNGWTCPDPIIDEEATEEVEYKFEGEIWTGEEHEQFIRDVTGCVHAEDAEIEAMVEIFQEMRFQYYPGDVD
ncbi:MAG: hypothetical protein ACNA8W_22845 [Bradymonadaceae bacterium]